MAGAALAVICLMLLSKRAGVSPEAAQWTAVLALPLGVWGGHLLYGALLANLEVTIYGFSFLFQPWMGGFMLYGALLGAAAGAWIAAKCLKKTKELPALLDCLAVSLLLLSAVIRLAEPFDTPDGYGQGYGIAMEEMTVLPLPLKTLLCYVIDPEYMDEWYLAVFALEAIWALFAAVQAMRGLRRRAPGQTALLALILYAAGQLFFEFLRRDFTVNWRFVRLSQLISAILLAVLLLFATLRKRVAGKRAVRSWIGLLLGTGVIIAMEFADEKPLILSDEMKIFFPHWFTYALLLLSSILMGRIVWRAVSGSPRDAAR